MNKNNILAILIIFAVHLVLRTSSIDSMPIFADESIYIRWSQLINSVSSLVFIPLSDGKQPLFMWVISFFIDKFADPLIVARVISATFSSVSLFSILYIAYSLFRNIKLATFAILIWSVIPFSVLFERMSVVDSFMNSLVLLAISTQLLFMKSKKTIYLLLSGILFSMAYLTKSPAIFIQLVFLISSVAIRFKRNSLKDNISKKIIPIVISLSVSVLIYNLILRTSDQFHLIDSRNKDYVRPISQILNNPADPLIPHFKDAIESHLYLITPLILGSILITMIKRDRFNGQKIFLTTMWILPIIVVCATAQAYTSRYIFFTIPYLAILSGYAVNVLAKNRNKSALIAPIIAVAIIVPMLSSMTLIFNPKESLLPKRDYEGYISGWTSGWHLQEFSQIIIESSKNKKSIVAAEGFFGTPFDAMQIYLNKHSNIVVIGHPAWTDRPSQGIINAAKENDAYLVVNSSRSNINELDPNLKVILKKKKPTPKGQKQDYAILYKVI